jgi:hypothetical protein
MAYPAGLDGIGATTYSCFKISGCMKTLKIPQIVIVPLLVPLLDLNAFFFALEAGQIFSQLCGTLKWHFWQIFCRA